MDQLRFDRLINEFCAKGNLEKYRTVLVKLFKEIFNAGCSISARYDSSKCSHSKDPKSCRIMISLLPGLHKKPEHIIWTILHEFGHHFSPLAVDDKHDINKIIESEERAWVWASHKVRQISEFNEMLDDFNSCKEQYLRTYYHHRNENSSK
jgi:hypothetical protein